MTLDALAIARRLVAAPWWEWREGMPTMLQSGSWSWRIVVVDPDGLGLIEDTGSRTWGLDPLDGRDLYTDDDILPDLDDPATAGALLGMLDEATPKRLEVASESDGWWVSGPTLVGPCDTLGEAVALALLAIRGE